MTQWQDRAACLGNKLGPGAWSEVRQGRPMGAGLDALAVCQQLCPVTQQCFAWYNDWTAGPPLNIVAGSGWWDAKGKFRMRPVEDLPGPNPYRPLRRHYRARPVQAKEVTAA